MMQVADTCAAISDAGKHRPISGGGSSVPLLVLHLHSSWTVNSGIISSLVIPHQLSFPVITRFLIFRATFSRLHASSTLLFLSLLLLDTVIATSSDLISLPLPATPSADQEWLPRWFDRPTFSRVELHRKTSRFRAHHVDCLNVCFISQSQASASP